MASYELTKELRLNGNGELSGVGGSMGRLEGKVAVMTAATSGMALATAKLFVEEGACVFFTGRRQDKLDEAVSTIGGNIVGVRGDASDLDDLDRLYETI